MYYKIENNYPIISPILLEGFIQYDEANKPKELEDIISYNSLKEAKEAKRNTIRNEFITEAELPVEVNLIKYHGGFESASKLDAAKRMVEASGGTEVIFFDINNIGHTLSLIDAQIVILTIGNDYQNKFSIKQAKMVQVENATTIEELETIV